MVRVAIIPNELQGGDNSGVWVEGHSPPSALTRLGAAKVEYLVRGVAQLRGNARVLELFGGTGLSTVIIAGQLTRADRLVSVDLHYAGGAWHYCAQDNYDQTARAYRLPLDTRPQFICADATRLPLADESFDYVIAPDSPRTRFDASGIEAGLDEDEQRMLFLAAMAEALRVLRPGGVLAATAPRSWCKLLKGTQLISAPNPRLRFKDAADPVEYVRWRKAG